jgi:hypothetical protein
MKAQPVSRISPLDLNSLMALLDVEVVALSECLINDGFRLEIGNVDAPGIHYILKGTGRLEFKDGVKHEVMPHSLWNFISGAVARSAAAKTPWESEFALQSFYHLSSIEPRLHVPRIASEKLLYIAAESDPVTGTLAEQRAVFETAKQGGEFAIVKPDHLATYFGQPFEEANAVQIDFLKRKL